MTTKNKRYWVRSLSVSILMGTWSLAFAGNEAGSPSTLVGARSQARGGATTASSLSHDALFQNPASSVFSQRYAVSVGYTGVGNSLAASIVDTMSGPVGGGVYYMRRDLREINSNNAIDPTLGTYSRIEEHAGFGLMGRVADNIGIGTNIRYAYRRSFEENIDSRNGWNFDIGSRVIAAPGLTLGVVAQNLLTDTVGLYPRSYSAGVEYMPYPGLAFSTQVTKIDPSSIGGGLAIPDPTQTVGWSAGAEFMMDFGGILRAGYQENPTWKQSQFAVGAGWATKGFGFDYAYVRGLKSETHAHSLTFTGFF